MYITEAHPSDVWQMESNIKDKVVFTSPKTEEERAFVAGACVRKLGIEFPAVLDEFGNSTEQAYTGWPDRIYLIDSQGRIAYKSKPGPFGFKPDQLEIALSRAQLSSRRPRRGKGLGEKGREILACRRPHLREQGIAESARLRPPPGSLDRKARESPPYSLEIAAISARLHALLERNPGEGTNHTGPDCEFAHTDDGSRFRCRPKRRTL